MSATMKGVLMPKEDESIDLPPGFRFHPTDEEIITHYLSEKVVDETFTATAIGQVDLNKCEPWDLPSKAKMGEKEWYFFCQRDRKYPTGMRTNRATEAGYWKATGKDKEILKGKNCLVGMKKTLVFYKGRAPKGLKTNWVMHEYRLEGKSSFWNLPRTAKNEWVVSRIFHKNTGLKKSMESDLMFEDDHDVLESPSLPPLMESPYLDSSSSRPSSSYINNINDGGTTTSLHSYNPMTITNMDQYQQNQFINMVSNPSYYSSQIPSLSPMMPFQGSTSSMEYFHHQGGFLIPSLGATQDTTTTTTSALRREHQCKLEQQQYSKESMAASEASADTSVVSRQEMGNSSCYEDFDCPSSSKASVDQLDYNFWKNY